MIRYILLVVLAASLCAFWLLSESNINGDTIADAAHTGAPTLAVPQVEPSVRTQRTAQEAAQVETTVENQQPAPWMAPTLEGVQEALAGLDFDEFIDTAFQLDIMRSPQTVTQEGLASALGVRNDALDTYSLEYWEVGRLISGWISETLKTYDRASLDGQQRITFDLASLYWGRKQELDASSLIAYPVTLLHAASHDGQLDRLLTEYHPFNSISDVEDYIVRLGQVDEQIDQIIALLEGYRERGIIAPYKVFQPVKYRVYAMMTTGTTRHPLFVTIVTKASEIEGMSDTQLDVFVTEAEEIINSQTKPAYRRLYSAVTELVNDAPHTLGLSQYPTGDVTYLALIEGYTDSSQTPDHLYEMAVQKIAYYKSEIALTAEALGIEDRSSPAAIFEAALQATGEITGEEALAEARIMLDQAKVRIREADVFPASSTPQLEIQTSSQGLFYSAASLGGSEPAILYVPDGYPVARYQYPSMIYRVTIPGQHLQSSTAQSLSVPLFREAYHSSAYSAGWAAYAEQLMDELGVYEDNLYGRIGWLENQLKSAVMMAVDVGLHHLGWTTDVALGFAIDSTGFSSSEAERSVLIPTAVPGYGLAAVSGQAEILRLREQARDALGETFDLKSFHDIVLQNGNVHLSIVRQQVEAWLASALSR